jgi:putative protease
MAAASTTKSLGLSLPLLAAAPPDEDDAPAWHGWSALDAPEPLLPQGEYAAGESEGTPLSVIGRETGGSVVELLAPAGGQDAAFAAFHYGADAVYLGLKKFSARAEAENLTVEEVDEVTAYAHSLTPRRRVFVTVNTVIRQDELEELVEAVAALAEIGVDAIILQDLGVYRLLRYHFPELELHASTQIAVHNRAGAETLRDLGFHRVVLARELTFEEVNDITSASGIETEVFIHGALCYSYSGLCLFSSQTLGRSGNRGKCAYSCRDSYEISGAPPTLRDGSATKRNPRQGFPFSMKDLALPDHIPALRSAGVSCFKIEGRKKSPLYVATTTDYYRRLIDGRLEEGERPKLEADMQTVFSRPWTKLFVQSHKDKEVADRDTVGHRGTPIGTVESVIRLGTADARVRFRTSRRLEKHDGLQIDLPTLGKPFGFPIDQLLVVDRRVRRRRGRMPRMASGGDASATHPTLTADAGSWVEVELPREHPDIPVGAPIYCSSSQEVKQKYRHDRPKPGLCRSRVPLHVAAWLAENELRVTGRIDPRHGETEPLLVTKALPGPFIPARDPAAMAEAMRTAFEKLGDTKLSLASFNFTNEAGLFVPVSKLNALRRELTTALEDELLRQGQRRVERVKADVCGPLTACAAPPCAAPLCWSIKVDRVGFLDAFEEEDWENFEEAVVDIARDHPALLQEKLDALAARIGKEKIRLALPALTRKWEEKGLGHKIGALRDAGWNRWEAANLSAWSFLRSADGLDLATDWSIYVINRLAAQQLLDMGVSRFALSPEDGLANMRSLLAEFADRAVVIVHQDTPLFLAESCAYANLIGGCPGKANCRFESMEMVSSHGEKVTAFDYHCRTIVLDQGPFCLSRRLKELAKAGAMHVRADFIYRPYESEAVRDRWRAVRAGRALPKAHDANFDRGIQ